MTNFVAPMAFAYQKRGAATVLPTVQTKAMSLSVVSATVNRSSTAALTPASAKGWFATESGIVTMGETSANVVSLDIVSWNLRF